MTAVISNVILIFALQRFIILIVINHMNSKNDIIFGDEYINSEYNMCLPLSKTQITLYIYF